MTDTTDEPIAYSRPGVKQLLAMPNLFLVGGRQRGRTRRSCGLPLGDGAQYTATRVGCVPRERTKY